MEDGSLRMYYIGSNEASREGGSELASVHQIGMAVSNGDITRWEAKPPRLFRVGLNLVPHHDQSRRSQVSLRCSQLQPCRPSLYRPAQVHTKTMHC